MLFLPPPQNKTPAPSSLSAIIDPTPHLTTSSNTTDWPALHPTVSSNPCPMKPVAPATLLPSFASQSPKTSRPPYLLCPPPLMPTMPPSFQPRRFHSSEVPRNSPHTNLTNSLPLIYFTSCAILRQTTTSPFIFFILSHKAKLFRLYHSQISCTKTFSLIPTPLFTISGNPLPQVHLPIGDLNIIYAPNLSGKSSSSRIFLRPKPPFNPFFNPPFHLSNPSAKTKQKILCFTL